MSKIVITQVIRKLDSDLITPVYAFIQLSQKQTPFFLLESAGDDESLGRFSYVGMESLDLKEMFGSPLLPRLDQQLKNIVVESSENVPGLTAGIVGHVSYHAIEELYPIKLKAIEKTPSYNLHIAQTMVIFDHKTHSLLLVKNIVNATEQDFIKANQELDELETSLLKPDSVTESLAIPKATHSLTFKSSFTKEGFTGAVLKAKDYIVAGDAFQIVLSQQFTAEGEINGFQLYRHLRKLNPAPFLSYVKFPELEVLCSSPEMLVKMDGKTIETVPIAGTRPVHDDGLDDQRADELLADHKELAEHLMLVDLGRNDIGKVSRPGTVEVTEFCKVKRFSKVMHLVSKVQGIPEPEVGLIQGLSAAFPAGTVTGAPKLRAMEIIDELEPVPRGLYAGSIVILDPSGYLNSCIAIRTITLKDNKIVIQAGAGIVYDSNPEMEYQETLNKAKALFNAVEACTSGGVQYDFND